MLTAMGVALARILSPSGRRGRLAVFNYHQVVEAPDPLRKGEPDQLGFANDLEIIARFFNVLPLPEAAERLVAGSIPERAASITFDDGYANNCEVAAPLLVKQGLPATFFIACGAVDDGIMWNDLVVETVARTGGTPKLEVLADIGTVDLQEMSSGDLVAKILAKMKYLPVETRWKIALEFFRDNVADQVPRLMMRRDQVAALAKQGFDIGGHTMNHPILSRQSPEDARREIEECRQWIGTVAGRAPSTFAYPNGIPGRDFGPEHEAMVRECGFDTAVSTKWALATPGDSRLNLPRIGPWWRSGASREAGLVKAYIRTYVG